MKHLKEFVEFTTNEAFVESFNEKVLSATTKEEVKKYYPNAKFGIGKPSHFFGEFEPINENEAIQKLADELDAEVFDAYSDGIVVKAYSTDRVWDDGVPVLKYISRSSPKNVKLPREFKVIDDEKYGWWYFNIGKKWYGIKQNEYDNYPPFDM